MSGIGMRGAGGFGMAMGAVYSLVQGLASARGQADDRDRENQLLVALRDLRDQYESVMKMQHKSAAQAAAYQAEAHALAQVVRQLEPDHPVLRLRAEIRKRGAAPVMAEIARSLGVELPQQDQRQRS